MTAPAQAPDPMAAAFAEARRRERERLARIIHDDLGQLLTAAGLELDLLKIDVTPAHPEFAARLTAIQESLERVFSRVRDLSREVDPDPVTRFGFATAVERLADRARKSIAGQFEVRLAAQTPPHPKAFYEVIEGGLDNIIRHSHCRRAFLELRKDGGLWRLEIRDDGIGFDLNHAPLGTGLVLMRLRSQQYGLTLRYKSSPGHGTIVQLTGH